MAEAMRLALEMPKDERRKRMQKMRIVVGDNNVYRWAGKLLSTLLKFEFRENGVRPNGNGYAMSGGSLYS